jgi:hypothetical protein
MFILLDALEGCLIEKEEKLHQSHNDSVLLVMCIFSRKHKSTITRSLQHFFSAALSFIMYQVDIESYTLLLKRI